MPTPAPAAPNRFPPPEGAGGALHGGAGNDGGVDEALGTPGAALGASGRRGALGKNDGGDTPSDGAGSRLPSDGAGGGVGGVAPNDGGGNSDGGVNVGVVDGGAVKSARGGAIGGAAGGGAAKGGVNAGVVGDGALPVIR